MKVNKKLLILLLLLVTFITPVVMAEGEELTNAPFGETFTSTESNNELIANNEEAVVSEEYKYENEETGFTATIDDGASLLNEQEKKDLLENMKKLTEFGHIAFVSVNENYSSTSSFSSDYYHDHYGAQSGSIFVIDMDNREIYIFSDGNNYRNISSAKAYSITDNTFRYASNEDYFHCAYYSFDQMYEVLNGRKIAEPMRFTSSIFIALTLSFFISFLIVLSQTKIKKATIKEIVKNCDVKFEIGETSAQKTGQHREYSPVSDGGGGSSGGGGGGGGGGGSSGGGGGHSF